MDYNLTSTVADL